MEGFTGRPRVEELVNLAQRTGIPLYEDLGSGCVMDVQAYGLEEPKVVDSIQAGVNLVSFSGDKLLGGAQAGFLVGDRELIARLRRNPLFRVLRVDKLGYQILEQTLRNLLLERWDQVPALQLLRVPVDRLRERAEWIVSQLPAGVAECHPGQSLLGGGSTPVQGVPTWTVEVCAEDEEEFAKRLRLFEPPIVGRVEKKKVVLDLRTVFPEEDALLVKALRQFIS